MGLETRKSARESKVSRTKVKETEPEVWVLEGGFDGTLEWRVECPVEDEGTRSSSDLYVYVCGRKSVSRQSYTNVTREY